MNRLVRLALLASVSAALTSACAPTEITTVTIYETPARYVRLELDRTVKEGAEHSHPISLTPEQIAAVLGGVRIIEPMAKLPVYDDTSVPRVHPAFSDGEIAFFAPFLALALSKAMPEEVVTFYQSRDIQLSREKSRPEEYSCKVMNCIWFSRTIDHIPTTWLTTVRRKQRTIVSPRWNHWPRKAVASISSPPRLNESDRLEY